MRTDRELLELAAKATGRGIEVPDDADGVFVDREKGRVWNPLTDDGDAFQLAVALRLDVLQDELSVSVKRYLGPAFEMEYLAQETVHSCRYATTRRAIVGAAAAIAALERTL